MVKNKFIMSKKLLFLLIILTPFTNLSYASFPIADTLEVKEDTLQTEEIKQYHSSLIKMGIDLNSCKCESCRNGIVPLVSNSKQNKDNSQELENNIFIRWIPLIVLGAILLILIILLMFRGVKKFNRSGGIGVG